MRHARKNALSLSLSRSGRRARSQTDVPMINVVFLLLIFFLISAQIAPPDPFETQLPMARMEESAAPSLALYLSKDGEIAFGSARGEAALREAAATHGQDAALPLYADARAPAQALASTLAKLQALGQSKVSLITQEGS